MASEVKIDPENPKIILNWVVRGVYLFFMTKICALEKLNFFVE